MEPKISTYDSQEDRYAHKWVNVSFMHIKMVCKYCDREQETTHTSRCEVKYQEDQVSNGYWMW